ncbi:MAG: hypothetical protein J5815_00040 [Clostridia bacterium]|nr:hypothetical protein [Clostridia bacterium]
MELKDLYLKKQDKNSMATCGTIIVDELRNGSATFVELCEKIAFPAETVRACLNVFLKNGIVNNFIGKYELEDGVGDFVVPCENRASNRKKYRSVVPAKCNLSLAVVGKGDKLHELDMLFCPFDLVWDEAEFIPADENSLTIEDATMQDGFDVDRYLAEIKPKVEKLAKKFGLTGAVKIKKGVPVGAGLGGSTASLVAVYNAFKKYADENGKKYDITNKYLTSLSSDFPAMALARACRVQGVGDKVSPFDEKVKIVFVGFKVAKGGSDTAAVYGRFDEKCKISSVAPPETVELALKNPRNDLFAPACQLNKEIKKAYNELKAQKPNFVMMTGSGSGIIALDYKIV